MNSCPAFVKKDYKKVFASIAKSIIGSSEQISEEDEESED